VPPSSVDVSADLAGNCDDRFASLCRRTTAVVNYRSGSILRGRHSGWQ
jgi:hypothetical protein